MTDYTKSEMELAADVAERVLEQLEGVTPQLACHVLSAVMATLIVGEASILARGSIVKEMQDRLAHDVAKTAHVAVKNPRTMQ